MIIEYIAGFFDGEGTVRFSQIEKRGTITISQTHEDVLCKIKKFFGFGEVYKVTKRKSHWKDAWVYSISDRKNVLIFIEKVLPYLIVKKGQALDVFDKLTCIENLSKERNRIFSNSKKLALTLYSKGISLREIEKITGVSRSTVSRISKNSYGA